MRRQQSAAIHATEERVKKLLKRGKQKAEQGAHAEAILEFDALLALKPTHANARFHKAQSHLKLNQLAEAIVAFEEVAANSDELRAKAKEQIAYICKISKSLTADEEQALFAHPSLVLRDEMLSTAYVEELNELIRLHQGISALDFNQQVLAIIRLINFCEKYYTRLAGQYGYIKPELLDPAKEGQLARLHLIGNVIAKGSIINTQGRKFVDVLEEDSLRIVRSVMNDLYLNDAITVLKMLFQSIHQLSRDKRGELVSRMPWGKNSWYHLDFCSTFFRSPDQQNQVSIGIDNDLPHDVISSLIQFQLSIRYEFVLVKAVIPVLLTHDLPAIRSFFEKVHAGLQADDGTKMQDLPNLRALLWHFKHSYQLIKLVAVLPTKHAGPRALLREKDMSMGRPKSSPLIFKPLQQMLIAEYPNDFTHDLKLRLSVLRRVQMVGEVFSKRNWGKQLDELEFMDPDIFATIRNGFSHPEELTTSIAVEEIESNPQALNNLYLDLTRFRTAIHHFIMQRQTHFPHLPDLNKLNHREWTPVILGLWQAVQTMYQAPEYLNNEDYRTGFPLLSADEIQQVSGLLAGCRACDKVMEMLNGNIPFEFLDKAEFDPEHEKYPVNRTQGVKLEGEAKRVNNENKKALVAIEKLLAKANREYERCRGKFLKTTRVEKDKRVAALKDIRTRNLAEFPTLLKLAADIFATYSNLEKNRPPMNQENLIRFLQQRVNLLHQLIMQIPYYAAGNTGADELKSQVCKDIDLLHAITYLSTQIISILNRLNCTPALSVICPALPARIEDYMQIRNALEHTDPVIDSLDDSYIQMASKSHMYLCDIALEFCLTHFAALSQTSPDTLQKLQTLDQKPAKPVKQRKAMTLSSANNNNLFERLEDSPPPSKPPGEKSGPRV